MVSLINHEYSRREAHSRLAWQTIPFNAMRLTRGLGGLVPFCTGSSCSSGDLRLSRWPTRAEYLIGLDCRN
jgi:hypothetical protein